MLGGAGYSMSNQGSSGSDATTNAGGGIGSAVFNLGSNAFAPSASTNWMLWAALGLVAFLLLRKSR